MDKNKICGELYSLPEGVIVRRRKSFFLPVILLLAGVALIAANNYFRAEFSDDMRSALVFIGGVATVVGLILLLARIFGSGGVPYHRPSKSYLRYEEFFFDHKEWSNVVQCVNEGAVARLRAMKRSTVPAVTVALYSTSDDRFAAAQAFEYADLEYRPLSELRVVRQ